MTPTEPADESSRLEALDSCRIVNTPPEESFDRLTALARKLFSVRLALITVVTADRLWVKSSSGEDRLDELPREHSFCTHAVEADEALICEDASADPRFADKPVVCNSPNMRFYAGMPLRPDGQHMVGTLCLLDDQPRSLSEEEVDILTNLTHQAEELLRFNQARRELEDQYQQALISNARYGALIAGAAVGVLRIDSQGRIEDANPFLLDLLDLSIPAIRGTPVNQTLSGVWQENPAQGPMPEPLGQEGFTTTAQTSDGREIPVHLTMTRVSLADDAQHEYMTILTDLTEVHHAREKLRKEHAFLRSIIDASSNPIYVKHHDGTFLLANRASETLAGLAGYDRIEGLTTPNLYPEDFAREAENSASRIMETGKPETLTFDAEDGRHFEISKNPLYDEQGQIEGVVNVAHDVSDHRRLTRELEERERERERQQHMLKVLHQGMTDYRGLMSGNRLWVFLLDALKELTNSEYGLIGEVEHSDAGAPELKIHAITDLSWSEQSEQLMKRLRAGDMRLSNPDSMLGQVFAGGQAVISDNPMNDERRGGLPKGHPPLHSYLGVPIEDDGEVIGMYAIANNGAGYEHELVEWLQPFTATCSLLINLRRQLAERDRFTDALAQARDEAEEANKAKTRFLSAMSHELRTPLNSILGFAQLLENSQKNPLTEKQGRHVGQIRRSGQHLLELINEVLDLARVESGRIQLSTEDIDSGEALEEAMETLSTMADNQNISVSMIGDRTRWPSVRADFTRLKQVLLNLLSNAIKYNRPEGQVLLHFETKGDTAILHCEDTGIGIPDEKMNQLFEPFDRLGADQGIEGTGIGLALTRRLIHAMEGQLQVESTANVGSDFQIHLPLAGDRPRDPDASNTSSLEFEGAREPDHLPRQRILYVEDNPANQRLMQEAFEDRQDLEIICVHNAELGLDMVRSQEIDMVLMDINLPGMDGVEALHRLQDDERSRGIPVVAISANAMESDVRRGLREGFRHYLTKPVDMMQLFDIIDTHLGIRNN